MTDDEFYKSTRDNLPRIFIVPASCRNGELDNLKTSNGKYHLRTAHLCLYIPTDFCRQVYTQMKTWVVQYVTVFRWNFKLFSLLEMIVTVQKWRTVSKTLTMHFQRLCSSHDCCALDLTTGWLNQWEFCFLYFRTVWLNMPRDHAVVIYMVKIPLECKKICNYYRLI